ncbi:hypothetical protein [Paenibacillus sp. FSL H7-0331]|uniref:hypothetical protein n=1 Tax=Paenibacillus sp. FSL H7-0331 TaxID=1920421 RepID=UPI00096D85B7|nr:hypothetical protein [Paenibacillus sp. FSL H7-0331]OMF18203.1 hypothetical protein BK127_10470 [Paenibacillus sp. FSL H7-0331]
MRKTAKRLMAAALLCTALFSTSAVAFADAAMNFEVTGVSYENGTLTAAGTFSNTGDKNIEKVTKVTTKIILGNDAGDTKEVANHVFEDLTVHLKPGETVEYKFIFSDVPEYTDATKWAAEEGDWEFTYFEE